MTAILRLQLDDKDPVRVNSAINQLAEYIDRNPTSAGSGNWQDYELFATGDLNDLVIGGLYSVNGFTNGPPSADSWFHVLVERHANPGNFYIVQIATELTIAPGHQWMRQCTGSTHTSGNWTAWQQVLMPDSLRGYIGGLTLSYAGATTLGIAAGNATSSDNTTLMKLSSAYAKTTGTWAAGSGSGALDTGSIAASTWYHVYTIERIDNGIVDILFSTSATAPTMPTSYTKSRRIGSFRTDGSAQIVSFTQFGDRFLWSTGVMDVTFAAYGSTSGILTALSVPSGVQVEALFLYATAYDNVTSGFTYVSSPDQTDATPSASLFTGFVNSLQFYAFTQFQVKTNTSAQIRERSSIATTSRWIMTSGWVDYRGRL